MRLALAALLAVLAAAPRAQTVIGLRAGVNAASSNAFDDLSTRLAPAVSVFADVPVTTHISVRPEAFFSSEGAVTPARPFLSLDLGTGEQAVQLTRTGAIQSEVVGAAVFAAVRMPVGGLTLGAYAGPAITAKVRERDVRRSPPPFSVSGESSDVFARTGVSGIGGLTVTCGRVGLDLRFSQSLTNVSGGSERVRPNARSRVVTAAFVVTPGAPRRPVRIGRTTIGLRAGVNRAGIRDGLFQDGYARTAPAVSVFAEVPVRGRFALRPEAFYSSEGENIGPSEFTYTDDDGTPVTLAFEGGSQQTEHVGAGLFVAYTLPVAGLSVGAYAGPAATAKVRERDVQRFRGTTSEDSSNLFARFGVSGVGGLSVARGALGLDLRVAVSVTDIINRAVIVGPRTIHSQVTTLALVYRIAP